jgi:hypothetical protein
MVFSIRSMRLKIELLYPRGGAIPMQLMLLLFTSVVCSEHSVHI